MELEYWYHLSVIIKKGYIYRVNCIFASPTHQFAYKLKKTEFIYISYFVDNRYTDNFKMSEVMQSDKVHMCLSCKILIWRG